MKLRHRTIFSVFSVSVFLVFFVAIGTTAGRAQGITPQQTDILYISTRDVANYDSLLHSYYLRKYAKSVNQHYDRKGSKVYEEFDMIPDSVLANRLRAMPTVIPMTYNSDVRAYIRMYVRLMSRRCDVMLTLSEYYFPMFGEVLDHYGVPNELKYLTIVESALNPQATSRVGAAGLWQFMYRTGRNYDLEVNSLVDDRRNPYLSTVAAARYLRDLYDIYHDWTLAIASYNCGPGNVNKAIARSGGKRDFWQIYSYLPRETRGYIPAFIAANYVMNYYHEHGIHPHKIDIPIQNDTINLKEDAYYASIFKYTGIEVDELRALNPQYRADMVPVRAGRSALTLPASKLKIFITKEDSIYRHSRDSVGKSPAAVSTDEPEQIRIVHKVKRNETMNKVASRYGVTVSDIKRWNKKRNTTLREGERLVIYRRNPNYRRPAAPKEQKKADTATVAANKEADTAIDYSTTPEPQEDVKPAPVAKPQTKPAPSKPAQPKPAVVKHRVAKGETLSSIARKYNTTVPNLKRRNNLRSDNISVGQVLIVK